MNLKSEIIRAAYEYTAVDATNTNGFGGFLNGAKWMQKTMIEKVEQWLAKSCRGQMIGSFHRFLEEN